MSAPVPNGGDGHTSSFLVISFFETNKSPAELAVQRGWHLQLGPPPDWVLEMSEEDIKTTLLVWELDLAGDIV